MYKVTNKGISLQKLNLNEESCDLLAHLKGSYNDYKTNQYYYDGLYFINAYENALNVECNNRRVWIKPGATEEYPYTVHVAFDECDVKTRLPVAREFVLIEIPGIHKNGIFNLRGSQRVFQNVLTRSEELTVDDKNKIQLKLLTTSLNFVPKLDNNRVFFNGVRKRKIDITDLLILIACEKQGKGGPIFSRQAKTLHNYIMDNYSGKLISFMAAEISDYTYAAGKLPSIKEAAKNLNFTDFELGKARDALNNLLTFDCCVGMELYEEVDGIPAGTIITSDILDKVVSNKIKVKYKPDLIGNYIAEPIMEVHLPRGTKVTPYLTKLHPELEYHSYLDEDLDVNLYITPGHYINNQATVDLLYSLNMPYIKVSKTKKGKVAKVPFHLTVYRLPAEARASETLTMDDVECLVNYICNYYEMPEQFPMRKKDLDFSKTISGFSETVSLYLRKAIDKQFREYFSKTKQMLAANHFQSSLEIMSNDIWMNMFKDSVTAVPKWQNANIQLYNQRVVTTLITQHEAADSMRTVLMGHFSRICPFDTPSGNRIGLTNSLALRCKIENGIPKAPYHKIVNCKVSPEIVWLSVKDEDHYVIASIMDLHPYPQFAEEPIYAHPVQDEVIIAKVPVDNPGMNERTTIESIKVSKVQYVTVFEDQLVATSLALIPFLGSNDGPRAQFGASMLRQSVPLPEGQVPYVYTETNRDIVNQLDLAVTTPESGTVKYVNAGSIQIQSDEGNPVNIHIPHAVAHGPWIESYRATVHPGDHVNAGDIVLESPQSKKGIYSPGRNVLIAYMPWYGYNFDDAIVMSRDCSQHFTSPIVNTIEMSLGGYEYNRYSVDIYNNVGKFVNEGSTIVEIKSQGELTTSKKISATLGKSGIVQKIKAHHDKMTDKYNVSATLLKFEESQAGDKYAGRHGNKGVKSKIVPNSEMPYFANGTQIEVIQNPCGIGSRMNPGQLLEALLGFCCYLLDTPIRSNAFNGATLEEIARLLHFCHAVCNSDNLEIAHQVMSQYPDIPEEIKAIAAKRFDFMSDWAGCFNPDGTAILYNGKTGQPFNMPVLIGCVYYLKLEHEVEHKRNERAGINDDTIHYCQVSKQPEKGTSKHGGQTVGEMELWALMCQGAGANIEEILNDKSDNTYIRDAMSEALLHNQPYHRDLDIYTETSNTGTEMLHYIVEGINGRLQTDIGSSLDKYSIYSNANKIQYANTVYDENSEYAQEFGDEDEDWDEDEDIGETSLAVELMKNSVAFDPELNDLLD